MAEPDGWVCEVCETWHPAYPESRAAPCRDDEHAPDLTNAAPEGEDAQATRETGL